MISLLLWQEHKAKHCQLFTKKQKKKKNTSEKKNHEVHEVSEIIWLSPSPPSIQVESDSSRCFFMDSIWIVGPLGQAIILFSVKIQIRIQDYSYVIFKRKFQNVMR